MPSSFLSKLNIVLVLIMAAVIVFLLFRNQFLNNKTEVLETSIKSHVVTLDYANAEILRVSTAVLEMQKRSVSYNKKVADIQSSVAQNKRTLQGLKGREATVVAKPTLVENKINKAYIKSQEKLACVSGELSLCEK